MLVISLGRFIGASRRLPQCTARSCGFSTGPLAASVLVSGERDGKSAAAKAVTELSRKMALGGNDASNLTLWFAKGYGARASEIGPLLREKLGSDGVMIGSSSEGGLIGDGSEVQNETFALSVLSMKTTGVRLFPFYSKDLSNLPTLGRGGSWSELRASAIRPSVLAFCALPLASGPSPQAWCTMLDRALCEPSEGKNLPTIVGGLTVGHHIFIDGVHHTGGAFGVAFLPDGTTGASLDAVVCQGAVPFGPPLKITGVSDNLVTELDGKNAAEVLEPLLNGPQVPGTGRSMAGIFVDEPSGKLTDPMDIAAVSAFSGRPNCIVRPIHNFTPEGHVFISPIMDDIPFKPGMHIQLHCMNKELALDDLRMRAGYDVMAHNFCPPDAAVIISCGARGVSLYEDEGVESASLRQAWGCDVPTVGFFAGGEIGPVGQKTFMHGYTTSCLFMRFPSG